MGGNFGIVLPVRALAWPHKRGVTWTLETQKENATNSCRVTVAWKAKDAGEEEVSVELQPVTICDQIAESEGVLSATAQYTWPVAEVVPYTSAWVERQMWGAFSGKTLQTNHPALHATSS